MRYYQRATSTTELVDEEMPEGDLERRMPHNDLNIELSKHNRHDLEFEKDSTMSEISMGMSS